MPPDILPYHRRNAVESEDPGSVQPARLVEGGLLGPQCLGESPENLCRNGEGPHRSGKELHGLDGCLSADTARARHEQITLKPGGIDDDTVTQLHVDARRIETFDRGDLVRGKQDTLGEEESRHELGVIPWCAHDDGERCPAQPNLEGILECDHVGTGSALEPVMALDGDFAGAFAHWMHDDTSLRSGRHRVKRAARAGGGASPGYCDPREKSEG